MTKDLETWRETQKCLTETLAQLVEATNTTYMPDRQQTQATLLLVGAILNLSEMIRLK